MSRKMKKALCYAAVFCLMPLGFYIGHLTKTTEPGAEFFLLGVLLFFVVLPYFDANRELFPDNEWKVGENGIRYRLRGAGGNTSIEYHVVDVFEGYAKRLKEDAASRTQRELPPS